MLALRVLMVECGARQPPNEELDMSSAVDKEQLFDFGREGNWKRHSWV